MKEIILVTLGFVFIFFCMFWILKYAIDTPDVVFSYSTKECIEVINADGTHGSCDNLPSRYNHIWGK